MKSRSDPYNSAVGGTRAAVAISLFAVLAVAISGVIGAKPAAAPKKPAPPKNKPTAEPPAPGRQFSTLAPFYKKHVIADGILIASSPKVSTYALKEAAYLIRKMLAGRDDVLKALVRKKVYVGVMAYNEMTRDIPEHSKLDPWMDMRARGLGGNPVTCGEENLLGFKGDPYRGESIFIHEFAHIVDGCGLRVVDKTFKTRLKALHAKTKEAGRFSGYGMGSYGEFWAEGVQSWFNCNRGGGLAVRKAGDKRPLQINTRDQLKTHMPELAKFLAEALGGNEWTYVPVLKRLNQPHLKGYDPAKAPVFKWPKKVIEAARKARAERAKKKPAK